MEKQREGEKRRVRMLVILLISIFLIYLISTASGIWKEYQQTLIENQKDQMLITVQILGENMGITLGEYLNNLKFLSSISGSDSEVKDIYRSFLKTSNNFICNIYYEDEGGNTVNMIYEQKLTDAVLLSDNTNGDSIWQYSDKFDKKYLVFKHYCKDAKTLCMVIDEEKYYRKLISDIHIGTNGYILVKNSKGCIVMHPDSKQWGIPVIEGRRQMYPNLDYNSLEQMVEEQCSGKSGVSEYYSYWWTDPNLPRVKKISAYAPARFGDDFWVISAVIDYDDLYIPIVGGLQKIALIFSCGLFLLVTMIILTIKLLRDQSKASKEIAYLRELNTLLEAVHHGEENIAHRQRLQIMGTMTGGIAHEFNNFLTPIMGHAELLMMELDPESDEFDSACEIYEASEKAKDVIRQISSLSRRNVETVYKKILAQKMLDRVAKMVESVCPANVHMEKDICQGDEYILGNSTQINQVILNICVNAVHAIGKNEGIIRLTSSVITYECIKQMSSLENKSIPDTWERYLKIDIEDNGCGMEPEVLRKIFNPFFTTKKSGQGTGLGLSLAEQIVLSHKGYIFVKSTVGKGSVFTILLPVLESESLEIQTEKRRKTDIQILIADDNAKILEMLKKNFAKINLPIQTCSLKEEIKMLLQKMAIDVIIIDEGPEDGSGVAFCMSIQGQYPDIMKFVMVDYITREIAEAKQNNIIDGYIVKPVSDTTILEAIRSCQKT